MLKSKIIIFVTFTSLSVLPVQAENVEIYLTDLIDNVQNGYCLDIARAQGNQANPDDGLQGHTCYSPSGALGVDQIFDSSRLVDGQLYMPEFDVCASVSEGVAGTSVDLGTCDGSPQQAFVFSGEGKITLETATDMCLTVAKDTRTGRSDANQIKVLSVEACEEANAAYQEWGIRSSAE
jgi:hypothetical protein